MVLSTPIYPSEKKSYCLNKEDSDVYSQEVNMHRLIKILCRWQQWVGHRLVIWIPNSKDCMDEIPVVKGNLGHLWTDPKDCPWDSWRRLVGKAWEAESLEMQQAFCRPDHQARDQDEVSQVQGVLGDVMTAKSCFHR